MHYKDFKEKYLDPYEGTTHIFEDHGFIVWRMGTGLNVELLHLKTYEEGFEPELRDRKDLVGKMVRELEESLPYYSVFGFCVADRPFRKQFYEGLGFNLIRTAGPYKHGDAYLFYQDFEVLRKVYEIKSHMT